LKKLLELAIFIGFLVGVLVTGVGVMSIFLGGEYINEYEHVVDVGQEVEAEILQKGTSSANGKSYSYIKIDYLGEDTGEEFTHISPSSDDYRTYDEGDTVTVVYDVDDPREAYIVQTPEQLARAAKLPYKLLLFGFGLFAAAFVLSKIVKR